MKPKLARKLALNRETIRTLSATDLGNVAGGFSLDCPPTWRLCPTEIISICPDKCFVLPTDSCPPGCGGMTDDCPDRTTPQFGCTQP